VVSTGAVTISAEGDWRIAGEGQKEGRIRFHGSGGEGAVIQRLGLLLLAVIMSSTSKCPTRISGHSKCSMERFLFCDG